MCCLMESIRMDIEASYAERYVPVKQYCIYITNYIEQFFVNQLFTFSSGQGFDLFITMLSSARHLPMRRAR
jgi:hypothetical protein